MLFPVLTESRCVIDLSGTWDFKSRSPAAWDSKRCGMPPGSETPGQCLYRPLTMI